MAISGTSKIFAVVVFAAVAIFSAVGFAQEAPAPAPELDRGAAALPAAASVALLCGSFLLSLPALLKL